MTYRLNAVQTGMALCNDAGEGSAILPAATSRVTLLGDRAPETTRCDLQGDERDTRRGRGLER